MKKILIIATIAAFSACNDRAVQTETTVDSTADAISDSLGNRGDSLSPAADSTHHPKAEAEKKR